MAINRRLAIWLLRAYIKKWGKLIFLYFIIGLVVFFIAWYLVGFIAPKIPLIHRQTVGVTGAYSIEHLPPFILAHVSHGLTKLDSHYQPVGDLASSWQIKDSGKTYIFTLKKNMYFTDGTLLTSSNVNYSFSDVKIDRPNASTIIFHIKEPFAPFLINVSAPIFKDGFVGIGDETVKDVKLNGTFVASLTLASVKNPYNIIDYEFFPTQESLRLAFVLGTVAQAVDLTDLSFKNTSMQKFPNATITKSTDYNQLITLFYNYTDKDLSDKKLRDALSYAIPDTFTEGERAQLPYPPASWAYDESFLRAQDLDHAKLLLKATTPPKSITIKTLEKYKPVAQRIATIWDSIGVSTKVEVVNGIPDTYQIFLGNFNVPLDPDQYTLWHTAAENNITNYSNQRIDKLLEDGRKTVDQATRVKTYSDFQKYFLDDPAASFLYFPYTYTVTRK